MNKKNVSISFLVLSILFCVCLIISNILAFKLIRIGPFTATAGLFIFPISYIVNDVVTEVWGFRKARLLIWCGFAMNFLAILFFQLAIWAPPAGDWAYQSAFETVLGSTPRIAVASLAAFLTGSFINAFIMSKMKVASKGKHFSLRAIISTIFGEMGDSLIFFTIFLLFSVPFKQIIVMALFQTITKSLYEVIILPVTVRVVNRIKKYEQTDVYDEDIDYNILSFNR
jgi:uncharacterized integral membrane protein (TIGR00697 family)